MIVGLSIGAQHISVGLFERKRGGKLVLKDYASEPLNFDGVSLRPSIEEIREKILLLRDRLKIKPQSVHYVLSGQSVIVRFSKLPPLSGEDFESALYYEAQQQFPFPLEELVWNSQVLRNLTGQKEMIFAAVKKELINKIHEVIEESLGTVSRVEVSPVALLRFFRQIPDLPKESLCVDLGAKTTTLVYCSGEGSYIRVLPTGGASLTLAIAKERGISFVEAEIYKKQNSGEILKSEAIQEVLGRQIAEISRSTDFFKENYTMEAPSCIYVTGGGVLLEGILPYFEKSLKIPVKSFLNVPHLFEVADASRDLGTECLNLPELMGICTKGAESDMELLPDSLIRRREASSSSRKNQIITFVSLLLLLGSFIFQIGGLFLSKRKLTEKNEIFAPFLPYVEKVRDLEKREKQVARSLSPFINLTSGKMAFPILLLDLNRFFSTDYTWVVNFDPVVVERNKSGRLHYKKIASELSQQEYGKSFLGNRGGEKLEGVNGVLISGFWRKNPKGYQVIYDILDDLCDHVFWLDESVQKMSKDIRREKLILRLNTQTGGDFLGWDFQILLPFKEDFLFSEKSI